MRNSDPSSSPSASSSLGSGSCLWTLPFQEHCRVGVPCTQSTELFRWAHCPHANHPHPFPDLCPIVWNPHWFIYASGCFQSWAVRRKPLCYAVPAHGIFGPSKTEMLACQVWRCNPSTREAEAAWPLRAHSQTRPQNEFRISLIK